MCVCMFPRHVETVLFHADIANLKGHHPKIQRCSNSISRLGWLCLVWHSSFTCFFQCFCSPWTKSVSPTSHASELHCKNILATKATFTRLLWTVTPVGEPWNWRWSLGITTGSVIGAEVVKATWWVQNNACLLYGRDYTPETFTI